MEMQNNKLLVDELELERGDEKDDDIVTIEYDITSYPSDYTLKGLNDMFKKGDKDNLTWENVDRIMASY